MKNSNTPRERITLDYWRVSLAYNQRREASNMSTSTALATLNIHLDEQDDAEQHVYYRNVHFKMLTLQRQIICGKPKVKVRK